MAKCPKHQISLLPKKTRFGTRLFCPTDGCTVVKWDGETSTPADFETRQARKRTHHIFDSLWRAHPIERKTAYLKLAKHLGLQIKKTHIGYFNLEQCQKTITFAKKLITEVALPSYGQMVKWQEKGLADYS